MPFTRTYNWGESLRLEAAMADGGLKRIHDRIAATRHRSIRSTEVYTRGRVEPLREVMGGRSYLP